jgi:hypothetical protein
MSMTNCNAAARPEVLEEDDKQIYYTHRAENCVDSDVASTVEPDCTRSCEWFSVMSDVPETLYVILWSVEQFRVISRVTIQVRQILS